MDVLVPTEVTHIAPKDRSEEMVASPYQQWMMNQSGKSTFSGTKFSFSSLLVNTGISKEQRAFSSSSARLESIPSGPLAPCTLQIAERTIPYTRTPFPPIITTMSSLSGSSEERNIHYALRNRTLLLGENTKTEKGLGNSMSVPMTSRGRGRKSHLSIAQDRAKMDMAFGKQSSIEWALRALKAHNRVTQ